MPDMLDIATVSLEQLETAAAEAEDATEEMEREDE